MSAVDVIEATNSGVLRDLAPREVFRFFEVLTSIPRGSGNEEQVANWVVDFARSLGLEATQDDLHCVLVKKPGQGGLEKAAPLILHGHLDMVCEKAEGVEFDFLNQPLSLVVDGEYISATGTSLGADNGIGVSYILALLESKDIPHPPLEAVLTAMEEKGKVGAGQFNVTQLAGRRMIDFNWITDKEILAGCSGDVTFTIDVPGEFEPIPDTLTRARSLEVRGLNGGHCEFDIQLERANALQVLARAVHRLSGEHEVRIADPFGGAQNSAIPADASAVILFKDADTDAIEALIAELDVNLKSEYQISDPAIRVELKDAVRPKVAFSHAAGLRLMTVLRLIPQGVVSWNLHVPGRVETSNNVGTLRPTADGARVMSTVTSALTTRKHELIERVQALVALAGGGVVCDLYGLDAPEFPYRPQSQLLATASAAYRDVLGKEPNVEVSQCSLELGMFSRRVPVDDIISIGTELQALHSSAERVNHKSVERVWPLIKMVVSRLG
ncbi:beta-Ala-His dipeptidase [Cryobacterium sp. Y29]|uniref:beta-Ala-His dipeptidase n=1 Tax=Cryobacterium sp. Y29 TaxID=2048285 RepID=UPI000CE51A41|nr:beta-Ala-His dipeptidase [Cryobacterium sp. Y29]